MQAGFGVEVINVIIAIKLPLPIPEVMQRGRAACVTLQGMRGNQGGPLILKKSREGTP
jgi:hypothetical protein